MRELKFRAWKMHNGKLRRYVYSPFGLLDYAHEHPDAPVMRYQNINDIRDFMPDADIIEQYTGLKDKNGKEIYEGDIVKDKWSDSFYTGIFKVEFDLDRAGFVPFACGDGCGCCESNVINDSKYVEVIGNIHENPELLKDAENEGEE